MTQQPDRTQPSRRAIVHGTVWAVPVVTLAAAAPAFAASGLTLRGSMPALITSRDQIEQPTTSATLTDNGAPVVSQPVHFTLTGDIAFSGGRRTWTGYTDPDGLALAPFITGGFNGVTDGLLTITHGDLVWTASIQLPPVPTVTPHHITVSTAVTSVALTGIRGRAVPVGGTGFLTDDGDLYVADPDSPLVRVASGVISAHGDTVGRNTLLTWTDSAPRHRGLDRSTVTRTAPDASSVAIGNDTWWLESARDVWRGEDLVAGSATAALTRLVATSPTTWNQTTTSLRSSGGLSINRTPSTNTTSLGNLGANSRAVGETLGINQWGVLWLSRPTSGAPSLNIASNVVDAYAWEDADGDVKVSLTTPALVQTYNVSTSPVSDQWHDSIPHTCRVVGPHTFLSPAGDLWVSVPTPRRIMENVVDATARVDHDGAVVIGCTQVQG